MSKKTIGWLYFIGIILQMLIVAASYRSTVQEYIDSSPKVVSYSAKVVTDQAKVDQDHAQGLNYASDQLAKDELTLRDDQDNLAYYQRHQSEAQQGMIIVALLIALVGILSLIAWIGTLVNLSRGQQWIWFILVFFLGVITMLIYLIAGPDVPNAGQFSQAQQQTANPLPHSLPGASVQSPVPQVLQSPQPISALEILQQRYARGEIDTATFDQMHARLETSNPRIGQ